MAAAASDAARGADPGTACESVSLRLMSEATNAIGVSTREASGVDAAAPSRGTPRDTTTAIATTAAAAAAAANIHIDHAADRCGSLPMRLRTRATDPGEGSTARI